MCILLGEPLCPPGNVACTLRLLLVTVILSPGLDCKLPSAGTAHLYLFYLTYSLLEG